MIIFAPNFCLMKKVYKVAGYKFAVVMPDDNPAWGEMQNYEPFLVGEEGPFVFTAELIETMPDTSSKKFVYAGDRDAKMPHTELYDWDGKWLSEVSPILDAPVKLYMIMDKAFTMIKFYSLGSLRFSVNTVMMLMFALSTARRGVLMMHASVTMHAGKGYLFLGKSGTGKSTHSQLWINNIEGCELLNDDNPALKVEDDGSINVYGSPWSGKTPCYRNLEVPVGAVVDLHQAKKNEIRRLSLVEAYAALYVSFSGYRFIKDIADGLHSTNEKIVSTVPCYSLNCLPDAEAAWLCYNTVVQ